MRDFFDESNTESALHSLGRQWKKALILGVVYLALMLLAEHFIPRSAALFPASAAAIATLFLEGIEFWPVVYVAALIGSLVLGQPIAFIILSPIALALEAVAGAYLMRKAKIDPLFRRSRDISYLITIVILVSFIVPTFSSFASFIRVPLHSHYLLAAWSLRYAGNVFCLLIITPFLLRWFAKPRFSRAPIEIVETVTVFAILIGLDTLFLSHVSEVIGIPLLYILLVPLFWIALRLRPRFVTLAMLITSIFAILSLYVGATVPTMAEFSLRLFQTEELLIVLAIIFFIVVSLEEDRRLNSNLLKSQVATLENAVVRITSESSAKNDFIAVLAHELRNPLAPVVSGIDFLKIDESRSPEEMETLAMMEDRMHTVRRLLDDLLDISRISEGKLALKKERINLEATLKHAILSTDHLLKERHQSLTFKNSKESLFINGDPVRLEQIFSNLLTNASKFSDSGDPITILVRKRGDEAEVIISDTGVGLEADALEKIFTPFHQADSEVGSKKGLGIGLALVRSFAEMHEGSVVATSKGPGHGSQFTVHLPLLQEEIPAPKSAMETAHKDKRDTNMGSRSFEQKSSTQKNGPSILVVDDNDAAAWGMGKLLELKGCTVSYAYDGRQAIDQAAAISPDIILLDLGLPDQDGYSVAKTIRARGYHGRLIALTGFSTEEAKVKGRNAGFEHYLIKPAGFAELKRVIPEIA